MKEKKNPKTVTLYSANPTLWGIARVAAEQSGVSLSSFVEEALKLYIISGHKPIEGKLILRIEE